MRSLSNALRRGVLVLLLLSTARAAANAQEQQEGPPPSSSPPAPPPAAAEDDAAGAAAILSAMASRAQQNSLSQTLMTMMALAAAEEDDNNSTTSANTNSTSLPPAPDDANNATAPTTPPDFRNALRAHLEDLVGEQQQLFVNALGGKNPPTTNEKDTRKEQLALLLAAKLAERRAAQGPPSIQLHDDLVLGLGRTVRAATTQQPGAGPCGQYAWDAGGEYTPATWAGPTVSLSLSLGSCALVPSLEGPGAALTAGSAWTNAVGELACLGPGLAYFLSPLTYTSAGITGEALSVPACRLAASFGPSLSLRLTRSPKNNANGGGGDSYASEGQFLAGAVLNGTLDKRIRKLRRAIEIAAGIKEKNKLGWRGGSAEEGGDGDGGGGDYGLAWEKEEESGEDGLQLKGGDKLSKGKSLLRALLEHGGDGGGEGFFDNRVVGAAASEAPASASASAERRPPAPDALLTFDNRIG
jgi:hypothetical protein